MALTIDPALFRPEAISAEAAAFNAQVEAMLKDVTPTWQRDPQEVRDERERGQGIFGPLALSDAAQTRTLSTHTGEVPVRMFIPDRIEGVFLHIHGGGWVLGRAHHGDPRLEPLSQRHNVAVVSVDYRLAPEHPYPAAPDDCEGVARWLVENGKSEFGTDRFVIGGESAGAHLAAVTLLRMRDRHGYRGFGGANMVYGVYDLRLTPSAATWGTRELILSTPLMRWFVDHFISDESKRTDPDVSPLFADLSGMPPALFTVGTMDPLLDDTLFMANRWAEYGNQCELAVYPGGLHGLNAFPSAIGQAATERMEAWMDGILGAVPA
ncbi:MAG TPA: alpha/beta hydrolase [Tepidiformaceae bacterium]|nr:alpha/beta hydrolase [Tepidiformaceae bacterium]